jgi:hypothetical protein
VGLACNTAPLLKVWQSGWQSGEVTARSAASRRGESGRETHTNVQQRRHLGKPRSWLPDERGAWCQPEPLKFCARSQEGPCAVHNEPCQIRPPQFVVVVVIVKGVVVIVPVVI